jgi:hypothetical protein
MFRGPITNAVDFERSCMPLAQTSPGHSGFRLPVSPEKDIFDRISAVQKFDQFHSAFQISNRFHPSKSVLPFIDCPLAFDTPLPVPDNWPGPPVSPPLKPDPFENAMIFFDSKIAKKGALREIAMNSVALRIQDWL